MVVRNSVLHISTLSGVISQISAEAVGDGPFAEIQGSPLIEGFYSRMDVSACGTMAARGAEMFHLPTGSKVMLKGESNGVAFRQSGGSEVACVSDQEIVVWKVDRDLASRLRTSVASDVRYRVVSLPS
jgi:hypothetical protein